VTEVGDTYQVADMQARTDDLYARAKYEVILAYLSTSPPLRILNAGCGSGELSFLLAERGNIVVGIDPAKDYIELARRQALRDPAGRCVFEVAGIEDYEPRELFDCVVATDVLEHIGDDGGALAKLVKMVRPEGIVVLTVPACMWLFGYHDDQLGHLRRYSSGGLRRLAEGVLTVDRVRYFGASLIPACLFYSRWMRWPYPVAEMGRSNSLVSRILRSLLFFEVRVPLPVGTSVILRGFKRR